MRTDQKATLKVVPETKPDITFTPEMVEAGVKCLLKYDVEEENDETVVRNIFAEMYRLYARS